MSHDDLEIRATNFELLRILDGHELTLATVGGTPVKIRLSGTDELLASHRETCEAAGVEPTMTRADAIALVRPLGYPSPGGQS